MTTDTTTNEETTMTALSIPGEVITAGWMALNNHQLGHKLDAASDVINATAALIVAAELTRIADELNELRQAMREEDSRGVRASGLAEGITLIRCRAEELRAERTQS